MAPWCGSDAKQFQQEPPDSLLRSLHKSATVNHCPDALAQGLQHVKVLIGSLFCLGISLTSINAYAQDTAPIMDVRRRLLEQAVRARNENRHEEALALIDRAGAIQMNSSVRRFQAVELRALGRLAESLGRAQECVSEADRENPSSARDQVRRDCTALVDTLNTLVGRITLHTSRDYPGFSAQIATTTIPRVAFDVPFPVTPGTVAVRAQADGFEPFHQDVTLVANQTVVVNIDLRPSPVQPTNPIENQPVRPPRIEVRHHRSPIGPVIAGVGVGAVAAGVITRLIGNGQYDGLQTACMTGVSPCDTRTNATNARSSIDTLDTVSLVTMIGGSALVATGLILFIAVTREERITVPTARIPTIVPTFGLNSLGIAATF